MTDRHDVAFTPDNRTSLGRGLALLVAAAVTLGIAGCEGKPAPAKAPEAAAPSAQPADAGPDTATPEAAQPTATETPAAPTAAKTDDRVYRIGYSQCTVTEPWRVEVNRRLKLHAEKNYAGVVELTMLDANDSTETQVAQLKTFIEQEMDAIIVSPKEAAGLTDVVREATEAGIPVVVIDRDVLYDGYPCYVGGDNKLIGQAAGMVAVQMLGGPGQAKGVIYELCGGLASTPGQNRRDGFHEIVDKEPGLKVIGGLDCDWKLNIAQDTFKAALRANDVIDLVYAHNDPMAHGAYQAAKDAGRAEEMKFIGIDALPNEGVAWVRAGELTATLLYETPGDLGLDMAVKILRGEEVPRRITLPTRVYTKENADRGGDPVEVEGP